MFYTRYFHNCSIFPVVSQSDWSYFEHLHCESGGDWNIKEIYVDNARIATYGVTGMLKSLLHNYVHKR